MRLRALRDNKRGMGKSPFRGLETQFKAPHLSDVTVLPSRRSPESHPSAEVGLVRVSEITSVSPVSRHGSC